MKSFIKFLLLGTIVVFLFCSLAAFASDFDPIASFTVTPSTGSLQTTFIFDASASTDQRGFSTNLEYRWNFDYGTGSSEGSFTEWSSEETITYQYSSTGEKTVALEVRDQDGYTDRTYSSLEVKETSTFDGYFTVEPTQGNLSTVFEFEAVITTTLATPVSDYEIRWDFDGDGEYETDYSSSLTESYAYPETGFHTPVLEIKNPDEEILEIRGYYDPANPEEVNQILVTSSNYPQASVQVYPASGTTSTVFYFDASSSFDAQDYHDLLSRYDFEGDGLFDTEFSTDPKATHTYDLEGEKEVILQVKDSDGLTDEVYLTIEIRETDLPPEAKFYVYSDAGLEDNQVGTTATEFRFNAASSNDEEDSSSDLKIRWDFEGDDDFDTTFSTEKTAYHRYLETGEFEVKLQVKDTSGNADTVTETIKIVENTPPDAVFTISPIEGTLGTVFSFNASEVKDSQYRTSSLEVRWDFEGDGEYDTKFTTSKTTTHQYDSVGTKTVILQVKDPEGQTDTFEQTIKIISSTAPHASFTVEPLSGIFSTQFHFDASASYDGETSFSDLKFRWDFNYTGDNDIIYDTSWGHSETYYHFFDQTGEIQIRLEVQDEDEEIGTAVSLISIHWASPYLKELKSAGIIQGYSGGEMKPDQAITRAEFLKMVLKAAEISTSGMSYSGYFSDVKNTDWHFKYVEKASELGLVEGYLDGTFKPNQSITRAEAMKIVLGGFGVEFETMLSSIFPDISEEGWFFAYVNTAYAEGLVSGYEDGYFRPENSLTRGEAAKVIYLAREKFL